jgi:hypothetical protein
MSVLLNGVYNGLNATRGHWYIGQTGRALKVRHKEHVSYIKYNRPQSAYALHDNRHEYGKLHKTMKPWKLVTKAQK